MIEYMDGSVENILKCQATDHPPEIQGLSLSLVTTLLKELPTQEFCKKVADLVRIKNEIKNFYVLVVCPPIL